MAGRALHVDIDMPRARKNNKITKFTTNIVSKRFFRQPQSPIWPDADSLYRANPNGTTLPGRRRDTISAKKFSQRRLRVQSLSPITQYLNSNPHIIKKPMVIGKKPGVAQMELQFPQ